jgi:probable HAF family extracellular repeat protein
MRAVGRTIATLAVTVVAVGISVPAAARGAAAPADRDSHRSYRIVDLGTLGGPYSGAMAMNDRGDVVGYSATPTRMSHAFRWRNGVMTDLGALDPAVTYSVAVDVNNRGDVVGVSWVNGGTAGHAFRWRDGVMTDLGTLGGANSDARAINDRGQVVGASQTPDGSFHGFLWDEGRMIDLGGLDARGINDRGEVVGTMLVGTTAHGYRWYRGTVTDLGTLEGDYSEAHAINSLGWIAGDGTTAAGTRRAVVWTRKGIHDLGSLGGDYSTTRAISDRGWIVGQAIRGDDVLTNFLWVNGTMVDLVTRGIVPGGMGTGAGDVTDVNNRGQLAGAYYFADGQPHAVLYT